MEEKAAHFLHKKTSRELLEQDLPRVIERMYPGRA
jgi:hypothetical protein